MHSNKVFTIKTFCLSVFLTLIMVNAWSLGHVEQLGQLLYFDENLSEPAGQSCASCHEPGFGFADPQQELPVSAGVFEVRFGTRNTPTAAYAMYSPVRYFDDEEELWIGGLFLDSRASGDTLGDPLADQAMVPFLNPLEMNNPDKKTVIQDVRKSPYADLFKKVWGNDSLSDVDAAYEMIALSIAAFERSQIFAKFTSKYDAYLKMCLETGGQPETCATGEGVLAKKAGERTLSATEWRGLKLFMGENDNDGIRKNNEGAMCVACHTAEWTDPDDYTLKVQVPSWSDGKIPPLFTDFTYDNLGIPKNTHNLFNHTGDDPGLGVIVENKEENGKFRVASLRNAHQTAPYGHNGLFNTLRDITHFYNTRDVLEEGWAEAEYPDSVNTDELGNLGLSEEDEQALVEFMETLTDGYFY